MNTVRKGALALGLLVFFIASGTVPALAAPLLGLELDRDSAKTSTPVTHSDERIVYEVSVKNLASNHPALGDVLQCENKEVTWFGEPDPAFSYQWVRNGKDIVGATAETYTVVAADAGQSIQCVVTGTNQPSDSGGSPLPGYTPLSSSVASLPPVVVEPQSTPAPPSGTSVPNLNFDFLNPAGPVAKGAKLRCDAPIGWSGSGIAWRFQWLRNGDSAPHPPLAETANSSTYELKEVDVSPLASVQCEAIAKDTAGNEVISIVGGPATTEPPAPAPFLSPRAAGTPAVSFSNTMKGPVNVEVELPAGQETYAMRVFGNPANQSDPKWNCSKLAPAPLQPARVTCAREDPLKPEEAYPPIEIVTHIGRDAPDTLVAKASASGGGTPEPASAKDEFSVLPAIPFGFSAFSTKVADQLDNDYTQAGGHPFSAGASLSLNEHVPALPSQAGVSSTLRAANGSIREVRTRLPHGLVGNPQAVSENCPEISNVTNGSCPAGSLVGGITLETEVTTFKNLPVYSIEPEYGTVAEFGFGLRAPEVAYALTPELRAEDGYAISVVSAPIAKAPQVFGATVTLCGFGSKFQSVPPEFKGCRQDGEAGASSVPFITNPTRCSGPPPTTVISADSWEDPAHYSVAESVNPPLTGCDEVHFEPEATLLPTSSRADSPTGLDVELTMPTEGLERTSGIAQANLARSVVTLPKEMAVNPTAAEGLGACSQAEIGLGNDDEATCPGSSKVGTVEVQTPLLKEPLGGSVYLAKQGDNPFGSLLGLYLVLESERYGLRIKVPGKITPDPRTGQLVTSFDEVPEAPFSSLSLHLNSGERAPLLNPPKCGTYTIFSEFSPWSAANPARPTPDETVRQESRFKVTRGPGGGPCPSGNLEPKLTSRLANPTAGSSSAFTLQLSREDGTQRFSALNVTLPSGLTGYLKGIPYCPDIALAAISAAEGTGAAQVASPSCPAASLLGGVTAGAGAGAHPFYVNTGKVYLAGPYKGAPLSIAVVAPAVAGPFDLGTVVVRSAAYVNPETAQITLKSDPIPTIVHGIPLDLRDIRVDVDRPGFILAPTNCEPMAVSAQVGGEGGFSAGASDRFQVGNCAALGFKPKLALRLRGGTRRNDNPALTATLTQPLGQANIARAAITLPHSEFLDQSHIGTVCTRVQFAADQCPKASIYGEAEAQTPLLDGTLTGNVYLRSSSHPLPDLVVALRGPASQPIEVDLAGRIDSINGGIRNSFEVVPDAPVSRFVLRMKGGKKGLLVNSRNICAKPGYATVRMGGQNGKTSDFKSLLKSDCKKKKPQHRR